VTPSSSADAGPRTAAIGLVVLLGAAAGSSLFAAEGDFVWNTELREIY